MGRVHQVSQGECLASIAKRYGFGTPEAIFDHPDNAELKQRRKSPYVLAPGDRVVIPDLEAKIVDCAAGRRHRFVATTPRTWLRVQLQDGDSGVFANKRYLLRIGDEELEGQTDGDGVVHHEVPVGTTRAELEVWLVEGEESVFGRWRAQIDLGHLDPIDTISGVQQRLTHLGFGRLSGGRLDEPTRKAVRAFQRKVGLDATGELDDDTRSELERAHGDL